MTLSQLVATATRTRGSAIGGARVESAAAAMPLAALLALATAARFSGIGEASIWFDEAFSIRTASLDPAAILQYVADYDTHPPLYYLVLHYWIELFGDSEVAVRSLSAIVSAATVVVVYRLGSMLLNRRAGLMAGLLTGASEFHLRSAHQARYYALLTLLAGLSFLLLVTYRRRRGLLRGILYVVVTAALLYTHVYGAFLVAAQVLFMLLMVVRARQDRAQRGTFVRLGLLQSSTIALFAPWAVVLASQAAEEIRGGPGADLPPGPPRPLELAGTLSGHAGSPAALGITAMILAVGAAVVLRRRIRNTRSRRPPASLWILLWDERVALLGLWLTLPLAVPFSIAAAGGPRVYAFHYTIPASVALYLLIGLAAASLRGKRATATVVSGLALIAAINVVSSLTSEPSQSWREAARFVAAEEQTGDLVVFTDPVNAFTFDYYFAGRASLYTIGGEIRFLYGEDLERLRVAIERRDRVWLVLWGSLGTRWENAIRQGLAPSHRQAAAQTFGRFGREVRLYRFEGGG